ncbi:hypothetical protein D5S17_11720 [Pseudonocardiaceae bacterium YIM PH 21723]|nr:hypothetical protein D5S17_11720 [Pseudonocardiaceae bacterium YIM PH 21723]
MTLTVADVSMWAHDVNFDGLYSLVQYKLEEALAQARDSFQIISDNLSSSANIYEQEEQQNMHKFKDMY